MISRNKCSKTVMIKCPLCAGTVHVPSFWGRAVCDDFAFEYLRCRGCGSTFVDPMPDERLLDQLYTPGYLHEHYSSELQGKRPTAELVEELEEAVPLAASQRPGGRLLDIGCGAGGFLRAAQAAGMYCEGLERTVETAQLVERTTRIRVHAGEVARLEGAYDVIHLADVLEHQPRPLETLVQARRLLAPGGLLLARGPLQGQRHLFLWLLRLHRSVRAQLGRLPLSNTPPLHVIHFTIAGWRVLFERAGLECLRERIYEVHWPAPEQFHLNLKSVAKEVSILATCSPIGRLLVLGNRVISLFATRAL